MKSFVCPGPMTRRHFLGAGTFGIGSLGMASLNRLQAEASRPSVSEMPAVILLWLPGGAPHMEMYDLKPDAPAEYRGEFNPIRTNVPGIDVSEYLPMHAKCADKYAIIRSVHHTFSDHGGGHKRFLTGRDPFQPVGFVNDHPMVGSIVAKCRDEIHNGLPNYIAGTDNGRQGTDVFSFGAAYLGQATTPFTVAGDPADPKFGVQNLSIPAELVDKLHDRQSLLKKLDTARREIDATGAMSAMDTFSRKAVDLVTSTKAKEAFDLGREPLNVRERYGMHRYGQRCLLARRLVEAGCSFVTMVLENPSPVGQSSFPEDVTYNWDSHAVNCHIFTDTKYRLQFYDRAVTALIEDLYSRGLDRRVMLIVTGEFGRTPKIEHAKNRPGRDHWPQSMSLLVAGGGMRVGQIVGSTDSKGAHPKDRPLSPNDLWATMYQHMGIDIERTFPDHTGRPMSVLPDGKAISELIG
ncbi:DUF1501 domain-containing protein [Zavarzinella formosa]|uniref:DUF1501 domain-containing protein n=1 Tax=Zavarzinella formosa TaxID=360055 RepID=UPI0002FF47A5|nr:DUF1501 domain-containing protein [Zavarzinella formosa]